jgi:hypothetical protein
MVYEEIGRLEPSAKVGNSGLADYILTGFLFTAEILSLAGII